MARNWPNFHLCLFQNLNSGPYDVLKVDELLLRNKLDSQKLYGFLKIATGKKLGIPEPRILPKVLQ